MIIRYPDTWLKGDGREKVFETGHEMMSCEWLPLSG